VDLGRRVDIQNFRATRVSVSDCHVLPNFDEASNGSQIPDTEWNCETMAANGGVAGRTEGKPEYEEFVMSTYRALVDTAKKRTGFASPSIETFCRIDVGV